MSSPPPAPRPAWVPRLPCPATLAPSKPLSPQAAVLPWGSDLATPCSKPLHISRGWKVPHPRGTPQLAALPSCHSAPHSAPATPQHPGLSLSLDLCPPFRSPRETPFFGTSSSSVGSLMNWPSRLYPRLAPVSPASLSTHGALLDLPRAPQWDSSHSHTLLRFHGPGSVWVTPRAPASSPNIP